jgi:putative ubiquitin-RnfH superfamily antitoxin RatB of RatAB toxin-antitoxin module
MADIEITVCFSPAPRQVLELTLHVPESCDLAGAVRQACALSRWPADWPLLRCEALTPGLWGRKAEWSTRLREGDRVELYRPLRVDPKAARRERFGRQGARTTGLFAKKRPGAAAGY